MDPNTMQMDGGLETLRALLSLFLVLGLLAAAYFWLKRRGLAMGGANKRLRVVERLPIDTRRSILLLEVDGREMLVGVGGESINTITTLERETNGAQ